MVGMTVIQVTYHLMLALLSSYILLLVNSYEDISLLWYFVDFLNEISITE